MARVTPTTRQSISSAPARPQQEPLRFLWRFFASPRTTWGLLAAVGLSLIIGALLPQARFIASMSSGSPQRWASSAAMSYGRWVGWVQTLQLLDLPYAIWFRAIWALLVLNTAVIAVERAGPAWRAWRDPLQCDDSMLPPATGPSAELVTQHPPEEALTSLASVLRDRYYHVCVQPDRIIAQRFGWARMAPVVVCIGLALTLLGILLAQQLGWQEGPFALTPGQATPLRQGDGLTLTLDATSLGESNGRVGSSSRTSFAVARRTGDQYAGRLGKGTPEIIRGILFTQVEKGTAVTIRASDGNGGSHLLRTIGSSGEPVSELKALFRPSDSEIWAAVPERGILLHLSLPDSPPSPGSSDAAAVRVLAYVGTEAEPIASETVAAETELIIDETRVHLTVERYAAIAARRNPGIVPIGLGVVLLSVGLFAWSSINPRIIDVSLRAARRRHILEVRAAQHTRWFPILEVELSNCVDVDGRSDALAPGRPWATLLALVAIAILAGLLWLGGLQNVVLPTSSLHLTLPFTTSAVIFVVAVSFLIVAAAMACALLFVDSWDEAEARGRKMGRLMSSLRSGGAAGLTLALVLYGLSGYLSWGSAWIWDPMETWRTIVLIVYLLILLGPRSLGWGQRGIAVGALLGACVVVFVLFGAAPVTTALGLASRFISA